LSHRHPVAHANAPSLGRPVAERLDDTDGLVPRDEGEARGNGAGEQLVIRAAQATCLHAQQSVVLADRRHRDLAVHKVARRLEDQRLGHAI
jgi:hypothetical protein